MPKQLITLIGILVSVGVIALGFVLVALPQVFQAQSVTSDAAVVSDQNAVYEAQVQHLTKESERQDEIDANVADLRMQIPSMDRFDDVFEVLGKAAAATNVRINSAAVGEVLAFAPRTGADLAADDGVATDAIAPAAPGRQQAAFTIGVTAPDLASATAFLDALRAGPRLLSNISVTASGSGAVDLQISSLAYMDSEG